MDFKEEALLKAYNRYLYLNFMDDQSLTYELWKRSLDALQIDNIVRSAKGELIGE